MKIKAIIIDDEERARNTLSSLLREYCKEVEVIGMFSNVPDGVIAINKQQPDVVFLDIEMPEYNGFELLDFFAEINFDIIFVTAYSQYAIRAFEVSATDYLLKPVDIDALQKSIDKIKNKQNHTAIQKRLELLKETFTNEEIKKIALPMADGLLFIEVKDIILLEADGAYTNVFLKNGSKILVSKKLKFFEDILSNRPQFFRPHRSHLININYIKKYIKGDNQIIMDNQASVSLSRDLKQNFESLLKEYKLFV
ncbi:MAG: response regulator transcription factor [Bacteroidetes bacterium]|nr:response regulator transcription factor [Bacteroidota bacterium]